VETDIRRANQVARKVIDNISGVLIGDEPAVRLVVMGLLASGHVMVEGPPGVGKTVLAKSLARSIDARFQRIQCTADLLPSDITGTNVFDQRDRDFHFRPGPILSQIVLIDEINRASPRTQSAFLESLDEHQVTVDGVGHPVPEPFVVIATRNPGRHAGTFPLPDTELDRFTVTIKLHYPYPHDESAIANRQLVIHPLDEIGPVVSIEDVRQAQNAVRHVFIDPTVVEYVVALIGAARSHPSVATGPSTRATMAAINMARAHAVLADRDFTTPDDVRAVIAPVLAHRVTEEGVSDGLLDINEIVSDLIRQVPIERTNQTMPDNTTT
jgi:MoxR-like ATPase